MGKIESRPSQTGCFNWGFWTSTFGLVAAIIAIFIFITGLSNIPEILDYLSEKDGTDTPIPTPISSSIWTPNSPSMSATNTISLTQTASPTPTHIASSTTAPVSDSIEINDIVFARDVNFGNVLPIQEDTVFPDTLNVIYAIIEGSGLDEGDEFDIIWLFEDDELDTLFYENPDSSNDFRVWTSWSDPNGLEDGDWSVEIVYDGDVIANEEFEVTADEYVFPIRFAEDCARETAILISEATAFDDINYIYAYIEYANFNDETVKILWQIDNEVHDLDIELEFDNQGWECVFLRNGDDPLPAGDYSVIVEGEGGDEYRQSDEVEVDS